MIEFEISISHVVLIIRKNELNSSVAFFLIL